MVICIWLHNALVTRIEHPSSYRCRRARSVANLTLLPFLRAELFWLLTLNLLTVMCMIQTRWTAVTS
jgi:hypothetical protein